MAQDISVRQGNTLVQPLALRDTNGQPFNLAGSELRLSYRTPAGTVHKSTATAGSGFAVTDAAGGLATIRLEAAETRQLVVGRLCAFEIERRFGGDEVTIESGFFSVAKGINDDA